MRLYILISAALLIFCFTTCTTIKSEYGLAENYLPLPYYLKDGIVNKYYLHYKSDDSYDWLTDIEYQHYLMTKPNELVIKTYNPALEIKGYKTFQMVDNKMISTKECYFFRGDSVFSEIIQPTYINWANDAATYQLATTFENGMKRLSTLEHQYLKDTIISNKNAKIFNLNQTLNDTLKDGTVRENTYFYKKIYVKGIGLYSSSGKIKDGTTRRELVEQITSKEFNKMANHQIKRVAYIDPENRLDKNSSFNICGKHERIIDYYNSDPDAGFIGGKKALWENILPKINAEKLHNESGYLTFRFIINCNGEAGHFILEQADLNYQKKKFNPATIEHLYKIVSNLNNWRHSVLWQEPQDAYIYLTFKLKDGEIIELLP